MGFSKIADIIRSINLEGANAVIRKAYRDQGYTGLFGNQAQFLYHNNRIELFAPAYTRYMLYGRGPGKMPPKAPIQSWMDQYGVEGSPWAIMRKIAREGTKGNNFLPGTIPAVVQSVNLQIVPEITKLILTELRNMRFGGK